MASGNVTINEAREEHDSASTVESKRGSFVSGSTTDTAQNSQSNIAVASTVSGDTVNVQAGHDLTVQGATVVGTNDVNLAAGHDITITTSQDTQNTASSYQKHTSGIGSSGLSVTVGTSTQTNTANTSQVTNTGSTIGSLNGNLNIVAGNDLHVAGSDLIAAQNVTGNGFSAGAGIGSTGKATGPGSVGGSGGVVPMISQDANGDSSAATRSAIGAGTITVTNGTNQTQDIASLSRDTTGTNGTVSHTPDVNALLSQQAAGQVVAQGIGAYADMKRDDALNAAKTAQANGDLNGTGVALADYDNWKEGGDSRAILQMAGGALIGGLGGGSAFTTIGGAAGAGISSKLAGQTKGISDAVSGSTGSSLAGDIAGNIVSGLGGAVIGGTAGAAGASNVNLYNQGHDKNETEAQKEAADIRAQAAKERAAMGETSYAPQTGSTGATAATTPASSIAAGLAGAAGSATNTGGAGSAADMTTAMQLRTQLALQGAGILNADGQLTQQAIQNSRNIPLAGSGLISNPSVVEVLTSDGSNIADWGKYTTQSVAMPNEQSLQVHYYMGVVA